MNTVIGLAVGVLILAGYIIYEVLKAPSEEELRHLARKKADGPSYTYTRKS